MFHWYCKTTYNLRRFFFFLKQFIICDKGSIVHKKVKRRTKLNMGINKLKGTQLKHKHNTIKQPKSQTN